MFERIKSLKLGFKLLSVEFEFWYSFKKQLPESPHTYYTYP